MSGARSSSSFPGVIQYCWSGMDEHREVLTLWTSIAAGRLEKLDVQCKICLLLTGVQYKTAGRKCMNTGRFFSLWTFKAAGRKSNVHCKKKAAGRKWIKTAGLQVYFVVFHVPPWLHNKRKKKLKLSVEPDTFFWCVCRYLWRIQNHCGSLAFAPLDVGNLIRRWSSLTIKRFWWLRWLSLIFQFHIFF